MKVWIGYGSENSSNLVIIGTFKTAKQAEEVLGLLNEATRIAEADESAGRLVPGSTPTEYSDAMMEFFKRMNFPTFGYADPLQLLYEYHVIQEKNKLVITTEEYDVNAFVKVLMHGGAKIQIYSAHDHGGPYGRRTHA